MANPERGEVDLSLPSGKVLTLVFTNNALCELTKIFGTKGPEDFDARMAHMDIHLDYRAALFCALKRHHGRQYQTVEQVGALMDEVGLPAALKAVNDAYGLHVTRLFEQMEQINIGSSEGEGPKEVSPGENT